MRPIRLTVIVGVSASGKSRRVEQLAAERGLGPGQCKGDWDGWHERRLRDALYQELAQGVPFVVEAAGFVYPGTLEGFLGELDDRLPGIDVEVEFFDNHPLYSMSLALADADKPYGGNGRLARVAEIGRLCRVYRPNPALGVIHAIHPLTDLCLYEPGRNAAYDDVLARIAAIPTETGRPLGQMGGGNWKAMPNEKHDELIPQVADLVRQGLPVVG